MIDSVLGRVSCPSVNTLTYTGMNEICFGFSGELCFLGIEGKLKFHQTKVMPEGMGPRVCIKLMTRVEVDGNDSSNTWSLDTNELKRLQSNETRHGDDGTFTSN